jgi:hypothetical protein
MVAELNTAGILRSRVHFQFYHLGRTWQLKGTSFQIDCDSQQTLLAAIANAQKAMLATPGVKPCPPKRRIGRRKTRDKTERCPICRGVVEASLIKPRTIMVPACIRCQGASEALIRRRLKATEKLSTEILELRRKETHDVSKPEEGTEVPD